MSISQNFPEEGPTLNLNFAGSKVLDPRITFSRSSVGTYMDANGLIVTAAADEPRFDHRYVNGEVESLGLLVEESRTNFARFSGRPDVNWILDVSGGNGTSFIDGEIVTSSSGGLSATYVEELSSSTQIVVKLSSGYPAGILTGATSGATRNITSQLSPGGATNVSATITNEVVAPDGTQNALLVAPTTTGSQLRLVQKTYVTSTAGTYTFSIFFKNKNISNDRVAIRLSNETATADVRANFVLSTKSFQTVSTAGGWTGSVGYQDYPNDWIRMWVTGTTSANTHTTVSGNFWLGGYQGTAETNGSLYVWESQIETGAFLTSQIQTTYSTATRSPDNVSMTGTNFSDWYNQNEGSILWRGTIHSAPISGSRIFEIYNSSTGTERMAISVENSGGMYMRVRKTNDTATQTYGLGTVSYGSEYKMSLGVDGSSLCLAVNGEIKTTISDSFTLSSSDTLILTDLRDIGGSRKFTTRHLNLSYYPTRLSNTVLQNLTK